MNMQIAMWSGWLVIVAYFAQQFIEKIWK
jgi:hypothetical protein